MGSETKTELARPVPRPLTVLRFSLHVASGVNAGQSAESVDGRLLVGSAQDVSMRLNDPTVSRYHAEFEVVPEGIAVRDLGSTNGTLLGAVMVREVVLRGDAEFMVGRTKLKLSTRGERAPLAVSEARIFGRLIGSSVAMRAVYTALERASATNASVLITGESGTGKELAARALHEASERRAGPFEVVDCGALPPTLIESELFGHERGAFTGATSERAGAFERAERGTIFLDEIGELPLELQPKLLRVLAERELRRVGGSRARKVDVRVVAATHRDLRREVNAGRFRADLYYRLAVVPLRMPALRERLEDLPELVPELLSQLMAERATHDDAPIAPEVFHQLSQHAWPGNIRELRNWLEQLVVLRVPPALGALDAPDVPAEVSGLTALPFKVARERFERSYLEQLLAETAGNVSEAARRACVDRVTFFRSIRRLGLKRE